MTKYIAFLRGINVGGRTIKMADLKACFEGMGFENVSTLLQSGNVVFESDRKELLGLKTMAENVLAETFGYPIKVQVYSLDMLRRITANYPFGTADETQHDYVIFLENVLEKSLVAEEYALTPREQIAAGDGVIYWRVGKGSTLKTPFAKLLTRAKYKDFNTNRNLKTLQKIVN